MKYKEYFKEFTGSLEIGEDQKKLFNQFKKELEAKLIKGHKEHGDGVFDSKPSKIMEEVKMEAMDLTGWGMILWVILSDLEKENPSKKDELSMYRERVIEYAFQGFLLWEEFEGMKKELKEF